MTHTPYPSPSGYGEGREPDPEVTFREGYMSRMLSQDYSNPYGDAHPLARRKYYEGWCQANYVCERNAGRTIE